MVKPTASNVRTFAGNSDRRAAISHANESAQITQEACDHRSGSARGPLPGRARPRPAARSLGLTAQVNELVDQLAMAAADPMTSALSKRHLQLALLAEFAERCAGGPVATHQPLQELLAELVGKLRAES
jgi:hypothetical protein